MLVRICICNCLYLFQHFQLELVQLSTKAWWELRTGYVLVSTVYLYQYLFLRLFVFVFALRLYLYLHLYFCTRVCTVRAWGEVRAGHGAMGKPVCKSLHHHQNTLFLHQTYFAPEHSCSSPIMHQSLLAPELACTKTTWHQKLSSCSPDLILAPDLFRTRTRFLQSRRI